VPAPLMVLLGIVLIGVGLWAGRKGLRQPQTAGIDDRSLVLRRLVLFVVVTSGLNLVAGTQVTTRAVEHMESPQFCASCHVMTPEATAFDPGSHAGLECVDCHVGSGLGGWLESKLGGMRQLWKVVSEQVEHPIASGIASGRMVASSETCERCHWKERPAALNLRVLRTHGEDEANTPETTVLTLHVGGTRMGGIHGAHLSPGVEIRFVATDPARQDIPWVEYSNSSTGEQRTYVRADSKQQSFADAQPIKMECIDCHNRAAHSFVSPERAVDIALTYGLVSSSLPYLKKVGVEALRGDWASSEEAARAIPAALTEYYGEAYPELSASRAADVEEAGRVLTELWSRNVYPDLGVTWGTYPDNRGHQEFPGCFRCHEGEHSTEAGETITKNCFRCHAASAVAETAPEILRVLGLDQPINRMRRK